MGLSCMSFSASRGAVGVEKLSSKWYIDLGQLEAKGDTNFVAASRLFRHIQ